MSSEYYQLEKAAEVLGLPTAEINRLREKNQLRAFRDGSSWKFRKVDVDNYLAEMIKNRSKSNDEAVVAGESDFDLLSMDDDNEEMPTLLADSTSFDALMEDGLSLDLDDDMIDATPASAPASAPAASDDDELSLMDSMSDSIEIRLDKSDAPAQSAPAQSATFNLDKSDDDDLVLADDDLVLSTESVAPIAPAASDIDLAIDDDDLSLSDGSSPQLDLAGDSGLSLLDVADELGLESQAKGGSDAILELADDDDILALSDDDGVVENTSTIAIPTEGDFELTPDTGPAFTDDSESASQVIALDEENIFGQPGEVADFTSMGGDSPFGGGAAMDAAGMFDQSAPAAPAFDSASYTPTPGQYTPPAQVEATYSGLTIGIMIALLIFMIFPAMMMVDIVVNMWSWNEDHVMTSPIIDLITGMFGK